MTEYEGMTNDELLEALEKRKLEYKSKLNYMDSLLSRVKAVEKETNEAAVEYDIIADILEKRGIVKKI